MISSDDDDSTTSFVVSKVTKLQSIYEIKASDKITVC